MTTEQERREMSRTPKFDLDLSRMRNNGHISPVFCGFLVASIASDLSAIDAAHADELERVRREAYRQGVEDEQCSEKLRIYRAYLAEARRHFREFGYDYRQHSFSNMRLYMEAVNRAFRGARGIARVEIRQRLERLNKEARG